MNLQDKEIMISRIIELELEEIEAIHKGHRPTIDDRFEKKRIEINLLRCLLFGYDSKFCKIKKGS